MRRKEAKDLLLSDNRYGLEWFVDDMYDDFEETLKESDFHLQLALAQLSSYNSRTCKNCMYCSMRGDSFGVCAIKASPTTSQTVPYTYGCNRFKKKEN